MKPVSEARRITIAERDMYPCPREVDVKAMAGHRGRWYEGRRVRLDHPDVPGNMWCTIDHYDGNYTFSITLDQSIWEHDGRGWNVVARHLLLSDADT